MATKPNAQTCNIHEQIIEDPISGLTIQFERWDDGRCKLKIFGDLPFGNREFLFDENGEEGAAGTAFIDACRPTWLREAKALPPIGTYIQGPATCWPLLFLDDAILGA